MGMKRLLLVLLLSLSAWADPKFKTETVNQTGPAGKGKPGYTLEADYPSFAPPVPATANTAVKRVVTEKIERFKKEYAKDAQRDLAWTIELHVSLEYSNNEVLSLLSTDSTFSGGAHGSHFQKALILSAKTGKPLTLSQCFKPGSQWLKTMSAYCIKELQKNTDLQQRQIELGASAKAEHYQHVLPTAKGLRVHFQEYQVGPYVVGPQKVEVPYSTFKGMIAPDGPLKSFL